MNKKGEFLTLFIIIIVIILTIIGIGAIVYHSILRESECKQNCQEYDAIFVDYENGYYSPEECWCKKDKEPLRIW